MSDESRFSLKELESIYAGDEEGLREILALFLEDAPERIETLKSGIEMEEIPRAAKAAHGLANLLGAIRNHPGVEAARETERALNAGSLSTARSFASRCEKEVEAALKSIGERGT